MYEHQIFFSARTQNGKLADREEIFSEFDKNCFGFESQAAPLNKASNPTTLSALSAFGSSPAYPRNVTLEEQD